MHHQPIIEHRKSTVREGVISLISVLFTVGGLIVFAWIFFRFFFEPVWPEQHYAFYIFVVIALVIGGLGVFYSLVNMRSDGEFFLPPVC